MACNAPPRLSPADTALLVIDVQEKLVPKIAGAEVLLHNIAFLLDACAILQVPATVTEQYPKGLGTTVAVLASRLPAERPQKLAFSSCAVEEVIAGFRRAGSTKVLVCGIEAHVCVLQTVLDLIALGFTAVVATDAIGSRYPHDYAVAIRRMEQAGAVPATVESAVFELTGVAGTPQFKEISRLVQQRMAALTASGTPLPLNPEGRV